MISDPSFTEAHRCHSNSSGALLISFPKLCTLGSNMKCTLVSVKDGEARCPVVPVFSCRIISHSVNGLVCIYKQHEEPYHHLEPSVSPGVLVYNLTSGEHVTLPPTLIFGGSGLNVQSHSLGFDPSTKSYKVLRVWMTDRDCKYEIFTLGSGAWRIIADGDGHSLPVNGLTTKGICLNGTIYWATTRFVDEEEDRVGQNIMIAFDVRDEKFRDVAVPAAAQTRTSITRNMVEIDGHIAILDDEDMVERVSDVITIWTLEDCMNGIWSEKRIVVPEFVIHSIRLPYMKSRPFVTSIHSGEITLIPEWFLAEGYVFHYNLEEESARRELITWSPNNHWGGGTFPSMNRCNISVYKESLISLTQICQTKTPKTNPGVN